jgi:N-acetylmuramoyl-L-alanine amidase
LGETISLQYPDFEVHYTRTNDVFLPLYKRIGIANEKKADLFISIHCNYISNSNTKGTETYTMGLHRADENLQVAQRENEVILMENDYETNYEGYDPNSPVGHIVLSSFQDAYLGKSLDFASKVEKNLGKRGISTSRGVKQAGFAVLRRATMPSVLIEAGFISNESEEASLGSEEGQMQICQSIANALESFFEPNTEKQTNYADVAPQNHYPTVKTEIIEKKNEIVALATEGYRVQIAALKKEMESSLQQNIEKIGRLILLRENGYIKYQVGDFNSEREAVTIKEKLQNLGYASAFIIKKSITP